MRRKALYIMTVATLAILSVACKKSLGSDNKPTDILLSTTPAINYPTTPGGNITETSAVLPGYPEEPTGGVEIPSDTPGNTPSVTPEIPPVTAPVVNPTKDSPGTKPTNPVIAPTQEQITVPTYRPGILPTVAPTYSQIIIPTQPTTTRPTVAPTQPTTARPTEAPTTKPTTAPTTSPSNPYNPETPTPSAPASTTIGTPILPAHMYDMTNNQKNISNKSLQCRTLEILIVNKGSSPIRIFPTASLEVPGANIYNRELYLNNQNDIYKNYIDIPAGSTDPVPIRFRVIGDATLYSTQKDGYSTEIHFTFYYGNTIYKGIATAGDTTNGIICTKQ